MAAPQFLLDNPLIHVSHILLIACFLDARQANEALRELSQDRLPLGPPTLEFDEVMTTSVSLFLVFLKFSTYNRCGSGARPEASLLAEGIVCCIRWL
jgi:hypothetical protein